MTIEEYFGDWMQVIDKKTLLATLQKVASLYKTQRVCPQQKDIFRAFEVCPYQDLKVVFIGQDFSYSL